MVTPGQDEGTSSRGTMEELLDQEEPLKPLQRGAIVPGVVMKVDQDGILVSIGHKAEGVVPLKEMSLLTEEQRRGLSIGDTLLTYVMEPDRGERPAFLSVDRARREDAWTELEGKLDSGEVIQAPATGYNRGGLLVNVQGIQGFVPFSQVVVAGRIQGAADAGGNNEEALAAKVGETLTLKVMELDRRRNRVVLSERRAIQEERDRRKRELLSELVEGQVRKGVVSGISTFGAFVDLGGADGLIHISELSWNTVKEVTDVLQVGQEVEVYVLKVDQETGKIGLSLRRLKPEPWETVTQQFTVGQLVQGTVTNLADFGAFARITSAEGSVEGLIHISELSHRMVRHPREVVNMGDVLTVKVLHIDPERRRIGLSLKEAQGEEVD